MSEEEVYDTLQKDCHDTAFHCYGYSYIFDRRAAFFKKLITLIKAFGILIPLLVGSIVIGYGIDKNNDFIKFTVACAIPASIIQFLISGLAFIYKWDDELSYAYEAKASYDNLYVKYKKLGKAPPVLLSDLTKEYDLLELERSLRNQQDIQHNIKDWELRRGMRYSLREHREECDNCKIKPVAMLSTDCYVCGNFSFKYQTYKS